MVRGVVVSLAVWGLVSGGAAQSASEAGAESKSTETDKATGTDGGYQGVKPGSRNRPPKAVAPGVKPAVITWPGFQPRADGSARVFVQSTARLAVEAERKDGKVLVRLRNARIKVRNNRRPLDTRFFPTAVTRVHARRSGRDVIIEITTRDGATHQVTHQTGPRGYHYVFVDFPSGKYETDKAPAPRAVRSRPTGLPEAFDSPSPARPHERPSQGRFEAQGSARFEIGTGGDDQKQPSGEQAGEGGLRLSPGD